MTEQYGIRRSFGLAVALLVSHGLSTLLSVAGARLIATQPGGDLKQLLKLADVDGCLETIDAMDRLLAQKRMHRQSPMHAPDRHASS